MKLMKTRRFVLGAAMLFAGLAPAVADDWPTRNVTVIVPIPAGVASDIIARVVFEQVGKQLGQTFVIENRPGAGGTTAADAVAKSPKDGYTALVMSNAHAISAVMYKALKYDPVNDFQMVSMIGTAGLALVATPDFPPKDLASLIALVKANPGKYNFGSAGVGTTQQFAGELMKQMAGLDVTHVPYRTTPAALTGLLSKDVSYLFELIQTVQGQVQSGSLKAIAVTSPERNPILPTCRRSRRQACRATR
jgi:tripartite-type tricarboxylate transporter receptor subunit TctC